MYQSTDEIAACKAQRSPLLGIGEGTRIDGAIIDKNCSIGRDVLIANDTGLERTEETAQAMIADGIMMIQKCAVLPDGWRFVAP